MSYKVVILIGGQQHKQGSIFRPLSLDLPTPLFPVAGRPLVQHQIESCLKVASITEVLLIGCYNRGDALDQFITSLQGKYPFQVRYLQEYTPMGLGTGGGLYHFRDHILAGGPRGVFVLNCDVCCDFPLREMIEFYESKQPSPHLILGTTVNEKQSSHYGCIVKNASTHQVMHYVEKPETFISNLINTGIYLFTPTDFFSHLSSVFQSRCTPPADHSSNGNGGWEEPGAPLESMSLEHDFLAKTAGSGALYVIELAHDRFWSQIKTAGCAIYASRFYLSTYRIANPGMLSPASSLPAAPDSEGEGGPCITGNVWIHATARVDSSARLGPNVSIGANVMIAAGVRVRESIILDGAHLERHSCVLYSVVGWNCRVGAWSRVEGLPNDPDADDPHARPSADALFDSEGRLLPSSTILGQGVSLASEKMLLNCIVLPHKSLSATYKHQIIL